MDFGESVLDLRQFHQDFLNNLMPAVEGQFLSVGSRMKLLKHCLIISF
jgi:hypothetical protein